MLGMWWLIAVGREVPASGQSPVIQNFVIVLFTTFNDTLLDLLAMLFVR